MGASGYKILDLTISANTPDGNTWFEITQKVSGVNVSRRISAPTLAAYFAPDLSAYLTSATAAATYVPLTRNLTINGTTYNLSADRSWTIPTGGNETLAQTLALGNTSGANDIVMSTTQDIVFMDGDNVYYTVISNDQSQAGNRIVYLPTYTGQLAYHATGVPLVSGRITHATTNGALTDNASLTTDATTRLYTKGSTSDSTAYGLKVDNSSNDASFYVFNDRKASVRSSSIASWATFQIGEGSSGANWLRIYSSITDINIGQSGGGIFGEAGSTSAVIEQEGNAKLIIGTYTNYSLDFGTNNIIRTRLDTSGNFGIGELNPTARLYTKGSTSDSTAYALKADNSSSSALLYVRNDGSISFNSSSFAYGNFLFNAVNNSANTVTLLRSEASAGVGTYAVLGVINSNTSANNYTCVIGFSDNTSYDMATIHGERIDSARGAWHLYTRSGGGTLVNHLSTYVDGSGNSIVKLSNIPTSSAGLPTGALWSDSGTIKIV